MPPLDAFYVLRFAISVYALDRLQNMQLYVFGLLFGFWHHVAAYGCEEHMGMESKRVRRFKFVRIWVGVYISHIWSFDILHTQVLRQRSEMFLCAVCCALRSWIPR